MYIVTLKLIVSKNGYLILQLIFLFDQMSILDIQAT